MFFFLLKKNTLMNPLNQSVFCLYLMIEASGYQH